MLPAWLRTFARKLTPQSPPTYRKAKNARLRLEPLEDRTVPATVTWTGNAGDLNWLTATNWSGNVAPGSNDDVIIPDIAPAGPSITITLSSPSGGPALTTTVKSLTTAENITLTSPGGYSNVLQVLNDIELNATLSVNTLASDLRFGNTSTSSNQLLKTTGTGATAGVVLLNSGNLSQGNSAHTVTIGTGVTVRASGASTGGQIGAVASGVTTGNWVNQGAWTAVSGIFYIGSNSTSTFTNQGVWEAAGGEFKIATATSTPTPWSTSGTLRVSSGTMTLVNPWTNTGTIDVQGGTLSLGGTFTKSSVSDPGRFTRSGGTVNLPGTLSGGLTLGDNTGSWTLAGGTINGGTFSVAPGSSAKLIAGNANSGFGFLTNGVTLNSPIDFTVNNTAIVNVTGGLTLNTSMNMGTGTISGRLEFNGGVQTLRTDSAGELVFSGGGGVYPKNSGTLTLASGITVRGYSANTESVGSSGGVLINRGTIIADGSGVANRFLNVQFGNGGGNEGTIQSVNATNLNLAYIVANGGTPTGSWTNSGSITSTGGRLIIGDSANESWSNPGTITATGSEVILKGKFTPDAINGGHLARTGGTVTVSGTVAAGTLNLDNSTGKLVVRDGTFNGTTINSSTTNYLSFGGSVNNFVGVTYNGYLDLTTGGAGIYVRGGLVLNGTATIGTAGGSSSTGSPYINFVLPTDYVAGTTYTQSLTGNAVITFAGTSSYNGALYNASNGNNTYQTVTIGSGITIRGGYGQIGNNSGTLNSSRRNWIMQGTVRADVPGQYILMNGDEYTNLGTWEVTNGATLFPGSATDGQWTNLGVINASGAGSQLTLAGNIRTASLGKINRGAGTTVNINGKIDNTGQTLTLNDTTGNWSFIFGGSITGGTIVTAGSAKFILSSGYTGTLSGVTVNGTVDVSGTLNVTNGMVLNGVINLNAPAQLAFNNSASNTAVSQAVTGTGTINFISPTPLNGSLPHITNAVGSASSQTVTIGSGITVRGGWGQFEQIGAIGSVVFDIQGTIRSDVAGEDIQFQTGTFRYNGTLEARDGGTITLDNNYAETNHAALANSTLTGGTWKAINGGKINFPQPIAVNAANIVIDGPTSAFVNTQFGYGGTGSALAGLSANVGSLTIQKSLSADPAFGLSVAADFVNSGTLTIGSGTQLTPVANALSTLGAAVFYTADGPVGTQVNSGADSIGRLNASLYAGVNYATGKVGQAFQFTGASSRLTPNNSQSDSFANLLNFTGNAVSVAAWVSVDALLTRNQYVFDKYYDAVGVQPDSGYTLYIDQSGKLAFRLATSTAPTGVIVTSASAVPTGTFFHAAATYDGTTARVYINGVQVGSAVVSGPLVNNTTEYAAIGNDGTFSGIPGSGLIGKIDELGIWQRTLSAAEINFAATAGGTQPATRFTQTGGALIVNGSFPLDINLAGGALGGRGTIPANVINTGGTVAPGNSPGFLDIIGDYTQGPGGTLSLEIAGRDANVPEYDRLRVTGTASLKGTLHVELLNGFQPTPGDTFRVLTAAPRVGQFSKLELPSPGGVLRQLSTAYDNTGLTLLAQTLPPYNFGYATTGDVTPNQVALDAAGNAYVVGAFTGTADFDREHALPFGADVLAATGTQGFLAKYDPAGALVWVRAISASNSGATVGTAGALGVAIDPQGPGTADDRVYAVGSFAGQLSYSGGAVLSLGATESAFALQVTASGALVSSIGLPSSGALGTPAARLNRVAVAPTGNVVVAGSFSRGIDLDVGPGGAAFFAAGNQDALVAEYTPAFGLVRYGRVAGASAAVTVSGNDLAVSSTGDVWLVGDFDGPTTLAASPAGLAALTPVGGTDLYVLRLTNSALSYTSALARSYGGSGPDTATAVALDPSGNVFVGGGVSLSVDFDPDPVRAFTLTSAGDRDAFALKLDPAGGFLWARQAGGYRDDVTTDLGTDAQGAVYSTGTFSDTVDFDPLDGSFLLTNAPDEQSQGFIQKLDSSGRFGWAAQLGAVSNADVQPRGIASDAAGRVVTVGSYFGSADFDPTDGSALRTTGAGDSGFVASLAQKSAPTATILGAPTGSVSEGGTLAVAAGVTDADSTFFTYSWSVSRGGTNVATGRGPAFALALTDQGIYSVSLVVTDESGLSDTRTATVTVTNAAPVLNATAFGTPTAFAPSTGANDNLGGVIATGGGYVLVGVPKRDAGAVDAGAVDVYTAAGAFVRTLVAPTAGAGALFGSAVAVAGNYAIVGAPGTGSGTAYVYDLTTGAFVRALIGPTPVSGDRFGTAVAAVGGLVAIGAPGRTADGAAGAGAAYLYDPATGTLAQTFRNPAPFAGDEFGTALVAVGANLLVGAPKDDTAGLNAGAVHLFDPGTGLLLRTVSNPNPYTTPTSPAGTASQFGSVLAASGLRAAVGAPVDATIAPDAGAAYLFDLDPTSATFGALLKAYQNPTGSVTRPISYMIQSGTTVTVNFGSPHGLSAGQRVIIAGAGAAGYNGTFTITTASTFSFTYTNTVTGLPFASGGTASTNPARFGSALALSGTRLLVGADADDATTPSSGSAFLMDADPGSTTFGANLRTFKKSAAVAADRFGAAVALLGDDVLVGATGDDTGATDAGRVYSFAATAFVTTSAPSINENGTVTVSGSFTDAGSADAHTVVLDWGMSGTAPTTIRLPAGQNSFSATYQYLDDNPTGTGSDPANIRVRVMDTTPDVLVADLNPAGADLVRRFDGVTGTAAGTFIGTNGTSDISGVAVGPDGLIYVAYYGGTNPVVRFDPATGANLGTFITNGPAFLDQAINNLVFGPDGTLYMYGNNFPLGYLQRFDGTTGARLPDIGGTNSIFNAGYSDFFFTSKAFTFGPDGNIYVGRSALSGQGPGQIDRFDAVTGVLIGTFAGAAQGVTTANQNDLAFAPDGSLYVLANSNPFSERFVYQLDGTTGTLLRQFNLGTTAFFPTDHMLVGADGYLYRSDPTAGAVTRYDLATGEPLGTFASGLTAGGYVFALNPQDDVTPTVTVNNLAPAVVVRADPNPAPGSYTLRAVATDPGTRDTFTYEWKIGATVISTSATATFALADSSAVTVTLKVTDDDGGIVTNAIRVVTGTGGPDVITVGNSSATVNGTTTGYGGAVDRVIVFALDGDDSVSAASATIPVELIGGHGNDTLVGGSNGDVLTGDAPGGYGTTLSNATDDHGADSLVGGAGSDSLDGGLGDDTMIGGTGNDYYFEVPGSADVLSEATGLATDIDTIDYAKAYFGITFTLGLTGTAQTVTPLLDLANQPITVTIQGAFENLFGSANNDALSGNSAANLIAGGGGNDAIYGDGRDLQFGGPLLDTLAAITGDGADTLIGGAGADTVLGGSGNDVIFGGELLSTLPAGVAPVQPPASGAPDTSPNTLIGGTGSDTIVGGSGNDVIFGGELLSTLPAAIAPGTIPENNSLIGGAGNDTVVGGSGNDVIFGGELLSTLSGVTGQPSTESNTLIGGQGSDTIVGGSGNDVVFGGELLVTLPGFSDPVAPGYAPPADTSPNSLIGGAGNDTIVGGSGNDVIFGGELLSTLSGVTGQPSTESNTLIGGQGSDTIVGGSGNDVVFGGELLTTLPGTVAPPASPAPDTSPNSLIGGAGNDTIVGGSGNDVIFGGELLTTLSGTGAPPAPGAPTESNTLIGGQGSDTIVGGSGNDVVFGGELLVTLPGFGAPIPPGFTPPADTSPNSLIGGTGNDTIVGGSGNDVIFGGELLVTLPGVTAPTTPNAPAAPDDDSLIGGGGANTIVGGSGNDVIFGGELLVTLPGTVGPAPSGTPDTSPNSLIGGTGNDTLVGGSGNDVIFGGDGDDALTGGGGTDDVFEGGSGTDTLVESADADLALTPTRFYTGALFERLYDIERAVLTGGAGNNRLDASAFTGGATLAGGAGNDTLIGSAFADSLLGGAGNDSLVGGAGADVLDTGAGADVADGGEGNDAYLLQLSGAQTLRDSGGIDSIDLSGAAFGVTADLSAGTITFAGQPAPIATLSGAFENLRGTPLDDTIIGSADRNILEGGGGADWIDAGADADTAQGSFPQVVYLDFDSGTGKGEHVYTIDERNLIQYRLEQAFSSPFSIGFTQTAPSVGRFSSIVFNAGEAEALIAGLADELDWRNVNAASQASINVNGFLGRKGQPAATSANYVALTFTVTAHELGHLLGLQHLDALGPIGSGIYSGLSPSTFSPTYTGPQSASLTPQHIMASPASLGTSLTDALGSTYFGTRELVKLAFADAGRAVQQTDLPIVSTVVGTDTTATEFRALGQLPALAIPVSPDAPTAPTVRAASVVRTLALGTAETVTTDFYSFQGRAGEFLTAQVLSYSVRQRVEAPNTYSRIAVFDSNGSPLDYYGGPAVNAGAMGTPDALLLDVQLPADGLYYIGVVTRAPGVPSGTGTGGYELFVYTAKTQPTGPRVSAFGDTLIGGAGPDVIVGGANDDTLVGTPTTDTFIGAGPNDSKLARLGPNLRPVATNPTVTLAEDTKVAFLAGTDPNGDDLTAEYTQPAHGTVTYSLTTGKFTYRPVPNFNGPDSFTYTVSDGTLTSLPGTVTIIVTPVNDAPVAVSATLTTPEDTALSGTLTATDADGDPLTFTAVGAPVGGSVAVSPSGGFTFIPLTNFFGPASFQFTASDGQLTSNIGTVTITVTPVNDPPVAVNDTATTNEDTPVSIAVLANDTDTESDPLTAIVISGPLHGSLTPNANGSFTYAPDADYYGDDSFTYRAFDGTDYSLPATVTVTINPVNDAPTFTLPSTTMTVDEDAGDQTVTGFATNISAGPNEADQTPTFLVTGNTNPALFSAAPVLSSDGTLTYTTVANANGTATITVVLRDSGGTANGGQDTSLSRQFTITVTPVNDAPTLDQIADVALDQDSYLDVPLTGIGSGGGPDEANQTVTVTATSSDPSLVPDPFISGTGPTQTLTIQPVPGAFGTVTITVTVNDGESANASFSRTFTVTVNQVYPPVYTDEDMPVSGVLEARDPSGPDVTFESFDSPSGGTVDIAPDGTFTFTPDTDFNGTASFLFRTFDSTGYYGSPVLVRVIVFPVNDAPVAENDTFATDEDAYLYGQVQANDYDVDSPFPTATVLSYPTHGGLYLYDDGSFYYYPDYNFNGTDSFTYELFDGTDYSAPATVTITVIPVNDAPDAQYDYPSVTIDTPLFVDVLANDTDAENDPLTVVAAYGANYGTVTVAPDGVTYSPNPGFTGYDYFYYQITDGNGGYSYYAFVQVNVHLPNDPPVAVPDTFQVDENSYNYVYPGVLANDSDPNGDPLSAYLYTYPSHGSLFLNSDGAFSYYPYYGFVGTDTFTYRAFDGIDYSAPVAVTIIVGVQNQPPTANDDTFTVPADEPIELDVLANDTDPENDALFLFGAYGANYGSLTLTPTGVLYTPFGNFDAVDYFYYQITDGNGGYSYFATVTVNLQHVNHPPVAADLAYTIDEDNSQSDNVLSYSSDPDSDPLTAELVTGVSNGTLDFYADGSFTYTPNANFNGTDSFTYRVFDGLAYSSTASVTITIAPVNDPPSVPDDVVTIDEDSTLSGNVLVNATDVDGDQLTAEFIGGPSHGTLTTYPDGSYVYEPDPNYFGTDSFTFRVSDGALSSATAQVIITINPINDPPVATDLALTTDEDTTLAGPVLGTDVEGDPLTVSVLSGASNGTLAINPDGTFTYTPNPNFNGTDAFTYQVFDGAAHSGTATVSITVRPVNDAPTDVTLSSNTVAENAPIGTDVGGLSALDPDTGDTATFTLVPGQLDNAQFAIAGGRLVTNAVFDYEARSSYSVRVRATDAGGLSVERTFVVAVTNVNEAPTNVTLSNGTVAENSAVGTVVGVLSVTDPDAGDTAAFALVNTAGGRFALVGNQLRVAGAIDFEATPTLTVRVRVTDAGGLTFDKDFTITVTNVNEAPVVTSNGGGPTGATSVAENTVAVATVTATDPDAGTTLTYSISGGADAAKFAINPTTGVLTFVSAPDFEVPTDANGDNVYEVVVQASDGALTGVQALSVAVTNVNEAPTNVTLSNGTVAENSAVGTVVGTLSAADPDAGDTFTFALVNTAGGRFALVGNQLRVAGAIDFEATPALTVRVRATDAGGLSFEKDLTITVTNVPEVTGFVVQRGAAQRSYVRYVDVTLDSSAAAAAVFASGRVQLVKSNLTGGGATVLPAGTFTLSRSGAVLTLDFGTNGLGGNRISTAGDGYYTVEMSLDGDATYETARSFYRLLGDTNGDRKVDDTGLLGSDGRAIDDAIAQHLYVLDLDLNGDGVVNSADRILVTRYRGRALAANLHLDG